MQKFPVFSLFNREFSGDGFARDCPHHHSSLHFPATNPRTETNGGVAPLSDGICRSFAVERRSLETHWAEIAETSLFGVSCHQTIARKDTVSARVLLQSATRSAFLVKPDKNQPVLRGHWPPIIPTALISDPSHMLRDAASGGSSA